MAHTCGAASAAIAVSYTVSGITSDSDAAEACEAACDIFGVEGASMDGAKLTVFSDEPVDFDRISEALGDLGYSVD